MKYILKTLLLVLPFLGLKAQTTLTSGSIKMEITEATSDDPQMAMGLEMMKGTEMEVFFNDDNYMTVMNMMGGMIKMTNLVNPETKKVDMLFDAMGQKMWVETNTEEAKKNQSTESMGDYDVSYDKTDVREILGYKAYKATITIPNDQNMKVIGYVTEEIKTDANIIQGMEDLKLEGFPLEFSITNPQMKMTFSAKNINDSVDASKFKLNTEGYKKMSMEEFTQQMGGMGGMGF